MSLELYQTLDGSYTLLNTELHETYHSRHGAIRESVHVFIEAGLKNLLQQLPIASAPLHILEIGFGTGLNALLTFKETQTPPCPVIYYHSLETQPLAYEQVQALQYLKAPSLQNLEADFIAIHKAAWNEPVSISKNFILNKYLTSLQEFQTEHWFSLVYFDAFAPNVQPELWAKEMLEKIANRMPTGGLLVTYCAQGQFRRDLKSVGFEVERLPGPPGKREMTRAVKK